jgi:hypothetical protein
MRSQECQDLLNDPASHVGVVIEIEAVATRRMVDEGEREVAGKRARNDVERLVETWKADRATVAWPEAANTASRPGSRSSAAASSRRCRRTAWISSSGASVPKRPVPAV